MVRLRTKLSYVMVGINFMLAVFGVVTQSFVPMMLGACLIGYWWVRGSTYLMEDIECLSSNKTDEQEP